ncbi:ABC transporter permease [Bacillus sp. FJAT-49736]|uniref:ABC transporter permease n=1 Tax=Bacillus sp. FJAT-49736 TaxID=2833582 RepID=UPI001BC9A85B|nr:ABC transporter permease [Bacillus sp. FJAT-49736]MBS4171787.1 ABC transporter permease [Bacillus sp. FJAT-49736]
MFGTIFGSLEQGIIYAILALGVYLSFRVLDFPDLTVDGSFVTGAAVTAMMITFGYNPFLATLLAIVAGFAAGCITGFLHTKGKINPLLSGILMMIALYSINLRIMGLTSETSVGRPNIPLLDAETVFTKFHDVWATLGIDSWLNSFLGKIGIQYLPSTWGTLILMLLVTYIVKKFADWFLRTEIGLALRATGDNQRMIRSFSANTDGYIVLGLGIANALVAFAGALISQYSMFADVGMGIGMIIVGLASVIIGEAIFGTKSIVRTTLAVISGAIIYRIILGLAFRLDILDTGDMKLITAVIVILALILPKIIESNREKRRKTKRHGERLLALQANVRGEEETHATTQSD